LKDLEAQDETVIARAIVRCLHEFPVFAQKCICVLAMKSTVTVRRGAGGRTGPGKETRSVLRTHGSVSFPPCRAMRPCDGFKLHRGLRHRLSRISKSRSRCNTGKRELCLMSADANKDIHQTNTLKLPRLCALQRCQVTLLRQLPASKLIRDSSGFL